ncbi:molybdopterin-dependent oxidoreductase [Achromobacter sp. GG226]|uniref:molybdopterin-dependent oxidoreductase n=1 Tax=Verticiella alkaliphila TaxID=2779529 RepID=UPI001C0CB56E|nr:molybdopterin-dependent oxidoreductase [Verticiella sp. GG226]MBU4609457.1 molybdopterin-dependent oxidoreductase [Verticiella sp. GG226]
MPVAPQRYPSLSHWGAFTAVVADGQLQHCEPFHRDPAPSRILESMPGMVHSPLRITRPAVRAGWLIDREASDRSARGSDTFVEVDWDVALALVSDELTRVRTEFGAEALFGGSYGWSSAGRLHHARTLTHRFLNAGGGCVNQAGNYSWGAAQFLLPHVIGDYAAVTGRVTDWKNVAANTRLMVAFGGIAVRNGQITSGGAGEHVLPRWLALAAESGVEFVVVSPSRGDVPAGVSARWIPIRPNTDTAMMLGMVHTLLTEQRHDAAFVQQYCVGFDRFADYVLGKTDGQPKSADWAAQVCGVPAAEIQALARQAAGTRTMLTCAWSLQRAHHGEQPYWTVIALASALGQIGLPGGGFAFGHGSINGVGNPRPAAPAPEMSAGQNPAKRAIPVARIADMLLHPGETYAFNGREDVYPDIQMVYWAGGNPFHHHQDLNRLVQAWQKPQTVVVHESWWTPTARRADIVLPATTTLERNDIGGSSRDRFLLAMHQALPPQGQSRNDFDIYRELAARGGFEEAFTGGRDEMQWLRHIYAGMETAWRTAGADVPDFDAFWATGFLELPEPPKDFIMMEAFRQDPAANPLKTPSGRIEIYSERIAGFDYADCPPHPAWVPPAEWLGADRAGRFPLHLVTCQPADKLHSQMDAGTLSRAAKVHGRERVRLSRVEAERRGLAAEDLVKVFNDRGACIAAVVIDEDVMPGVAVMATGAWFDPANASLERHGNPNVLTLDTGTSQLTQAPSALSALVEIAAWEGPVPAVKAFEKPALVAAG